METRLRRRAQLPLTHPRTHGRPLGHLSLQIGKLGVEGWGSGQGHGPGGLPAAGMTQTRLCSRPAGVGPSAAEHQSLYFKLQVLVTGLVGTAVLSLGPCFNNKPFRLLDVCQLLR